MIIGTHDRCPGEIVLFVGDMEENGEPLVPAAVLPTVSHILEHLHEVTIEAYDEAAEAVQNVDFEGARNCIIIARECIQWQRLITLNGGKLPPC